MKKLAIGLKFGVSIVALYLLSVRIDFNEVKKVYGNINILYCIYSMCLYVVAQVLSTLRWSKLVSSRHSFIELLKIYYTGCFFNNFLPSTIGGDAVKAYYLYRRGEGLHSSMASVFMDRYIGLAALVLIGAVSFIGGINMIKRTYIIWFYPMVIAGFIIGTIVVFRTKWAMYFKQTSKFYESISRYGGNRNVLVECFVLSTVVQVLTVLSVYLISKSMQSGVGMLECGIFIPLINIITLIPVSVSGVGIREGAFVYLFGLTGVKSEESITISLVWFITAAMVNLVGGLFYLTLGSEDKKCIKDVDM
ncbi:MAG: flippase-like domain-containing protein [Nitrospirae bacterium]|nr:flippase-like domain-containing protein [Nitrospirota bacterium]